MPVSTEMQSVGLAFACGVLATVGVLYVNSPVEGTQLYAPTMVQSSTATSSMPLAYSAGVPQYAPESYGVEQFADEDLVEEEMFADEPVRVTYEQPASFMWAASVTLFAAVSAVVYAWRRSIQAVRLDPIDLENSPLAMAGILGKKMSGNRAALLKEPWHVKNKNMGAPLSKELRAKHGVRTLPVRVNDEVRIRKGEYAGATGKVTLADVGKLRVNVEGIEIKKNNGTTLPVALHPHHLEITTMVEDKSRMEKIARSGRNQ
jgi:large subunit ribosomal protein L26e